MPLGPRRVSGVRTTVVPLVAFASAPTTIANPKQPINCVPFVCGRLGIRELQIHS
jgi:hypothetical protein